MAAKSDHLSSRKAGLLPSNSSHAIHAIHAIRLAESNQCLWGKCCFGGRLANNFKAPLPRSSALVKLKPSHPLNVNNKECHILIHSFFIAPSKETDMKINFFMVLSFHLSQSRITHNLCAGPNPKYELSAIMFIFSSIKMNR